VLRYSSVIVEEGATRDKKGVVMCKVDIIDYSEGGAV
jgi:hypothetical protein